MKTLNSEYDYWLTEVRRSMNTETSRRPNSEIQQVFYNLIFSRKVIVFLFETHFLRMFKELSP